ncbi:MAG TPA: hypothetical protein VGC63_01595 [Solirubrobacterales bacterium]|jgi:hypothetical protein
MAADPDVRRAAFHTFRLRVEIDRNSGQIRLKALGQAHSARRRI